MTQEIKDKLIQVAETAWEQDQKTNPSPVNPHAYVYGFTAAVRTILENPSQWGLMPMLDSMDHIEESDQNWSEVVDDLKSQLAKYREALERIVTPVHGEYPNIENVNWIAKEALKS